MFVEHLKPPIPAGYQQLTISYTSMAGGLTVPDYARYAVIKVASQSGRFRDDGTDPTSMSGFPISATDEIELTSRKQLTAFKAIRHSDSGEALVLEVLYYKLSE